MASWPVFLYTGIDEWEKEVEPQVKKLKRLFVGIGILGLLSGCGKNIPAIDPALLQAKSSILVVTGQEMPDNVKTALQTALINWRDKKQTAFEWMDNTTPLTEEQLSKIKTRSYDYILVAGHNLVQNTLPAAASIPERKWVMLDDQLARQSPVVNGSNIMVKLVPEDRFRKEWSEWVGLQLDNDRAIEWVTTSAYPIPSEWAPSEEAEYINLADSEGWYTQFQFQVHSHGPAWIAVFAPLEAAQLQRLKTMQVPVINMASTGIELQWGGILASIEDMLAKKSWTPGIQPYSDAEAKINKNL
ncbi:hypothetical protein QJ48_20615 [Paenibacillus sp. A3]|nr:hypothetical protein QJ48_20615 [Paenibacillus sp. A3]